jgi:microsomal dipeptidase-like Zn-dependent dipeptidase
MAPLKNKELVVQIFIHEFILTFVKTTTLTAHINHIKNIAGIDHVGLGAGYDGIN